MMFNNMCNGFFHRRGYFNGRGFGRGFDGGLGEGYYGDRGYFGFNYFNSIWNILIVVGITILIAILIYSLVNHIKKKQLRENAYESLKMKYVQGEITEEEYLRSKEILDRK